MSQKLFNFICKVNINFLCTLYITAYLTKNIIISISIVKEIGIAALLFRVKPRRVEKFRKCRFTDVGKSELGKKEEKKKHAQNIRWTVHRTGDLINSRTQ